MAIPSAMDQKTPVGAAIRLGCLCAVAMSFMAGGEARAANQTMGGDVAVVTPLTLVKRDDLDMGRIIPGTGGGTVTLDVNGNRSSTGTIILVGTDFHVARFAGQGTFLERVRVTLPNSINLTGPGPQMQMNNFRFGADPSLPLTFLRLGNSPNIRLLHLSGVYGFVVGASLQVGANQPGGLYSGSFDVTVNYQ